MIKKSPFCDHEMCSAFFEVIVQPQETWWQTYHDLLYEGMLFFVLPSTVIKKSLFVIKNPASVITKSLFVIKTMMSHAHYHFSCRSAVFVMPSTGIKKSPFCDHEMCSAF